MDSTPAQAGGFGREILAPWLAARLRSLEEGFSPGPQWLVIVRGGDISWHAANLNVDQRRPLRNHRLRAAEQGATWAKDCDLDCVARGEPTVTKPAAIICSPLINLLRWRIGLFDHNDSHLLGGRASRVCDGHEDATSTNLRFLWVGWDRRRRSGRRYGGVFLGGRLGFSRVRNLFITFLLFL